MLKFSRTMMFGIVLILEDCALSTDQLRRADSKGECRAVSKDEEILLQQQSGVLFLQK